jgi:hypothetical protein
MKAEPGTFIIECQRTLGQFGKKSRFHLAEQWLGGRVGTAQLHDGVRRSSVRHEQFFRVWEQTVAFMTDRLKNAL